MQNRAAVMHGTHDVRLEDVPVPEPGPKDVLVEIRAVGVCGSDVHSYEEGRIGSFVVGHAEARSTRTCLPAVQSRLSSRQVASTEPSLNLQTYNSSQ